MTVVFFGAGASAAVGVPIMSHFVDVMYDLFRDSDNADYQRVFSAFDDLRKVYGNAYLDLNNVESVFAAFDMGQMTGRIGRYHGAEATEIYHALKRMIVDTVERTTLFNRRSGTGVQPEGTYYEFVGWFKSRFERQAPNWAFISLNYDIALDSELEHQGIDVDYGFNVRPTGKLQLLKLHGSVNWKIVGDRIVPMATSVTEIIRRNAEESAMKVDLKYRTEPRFADDVLSVHYLHSMKEETFIIPPSYSKVLKHEQLVNVWTKAVNVLSVAHNVVFIGYSVPETDLMIRYLFAMGTLNNERIRSVVCINNDSKVRKTYEQFLGTYTLTKFHHLEMKFDVNAIRELGELLR